MIVRSYVCGPLSPSIVKLRVKCQYVGLGVWFERIFFHGNDEAPMLPGELGAKCAAILSEQLRAHPVMAPILGGICRVS